MIEICYVSSASQRFDTKELTQLLTQAREKNERLGVTGLLLYDGVGTFIQALEGEKDIVEPLYNRIKRDDRHKRISLLGLREVNERAFGNWCMGFRLLNHPEIVNKEGFSDFFNTSSTMSNDDESIVSSFALRMLNYFRDFANTEDQDKHNI